MPPAAPHATLLPRHHHGAVLSCAFLDGNRIVTGGEDKCLAVTTLRPTPTTPAKSVDVFKSHERGINSLDVVSRNQGQSIVVSASRDMSVKLWAVDDAGDRTKPVGNFLGHTLSIMAVGAHKDGGMIVSGARDYMVKVWDSQTCQCTSTSKVSRNLVTCLKLWPDGSYKFAQGSEDLTMRVWDVRFITNNSTSANCGVTFGKYLYFPLDVDVAQSGHEVVSSSKGFDGSGCEGRVWDIRSPDKPVHVLEGHTQDAVACCLVEPSGGRIKGWEGGALMVTASKDETLRVWDTLTGTCMCVHTEEGCGMWTSVRAYNGVESEDPKWRPHIVATTYLGGIYVLQIVVSERGDGKVALVGLNTVRPQVEEYDLSNGVPLPTEI
jgi:WD40 repeat protein